METYLFIDLSYFIFYLYYSKKKYLECQKMDTENLINNKYFLELFSNFEKKIEEIKKKLKLDNNIKIIFAKDCRRKDIWRNEIFPNYKQNRKINVEVGDFFLYTYNNIIEKYNYIEMEKCEADDIIGILTKELCKNNKIYIITDDLDYLQLLDENVKIYNLKYKNLEEKSIGRDKDLLKKIILGDKSDNIPSIHKKLGEKTAEKYLNNIKELEKKLLDENIKKQYELNKKLIDMNLIPTKYINNIIENFKKKNF